jgi:hypothetical protein
MFNHDELDPLMPIVAADREPAVRRGTAGTSGLLNP